MQAQRLRGVSCRNMLGIGLQEVEETLQDTFLVLLLTHTGYKSY